MSALPVVASMATYPPRYNQALAAMQHVAPQVDRMLVYVNDYHEGSFHTPPWMQRTPANVHVTLGSEARGDLSGYGKFFFAPALPESYHLTLDDDIQYPANYVERLVAGIERHERRYVCGFHGCKVNPNAPGYYNGGQVRKRHFAQAEPEDRPVHLLGTGVMGYCTSALRITLKDFLFKNAGDIWFAVACQKQGVGMVSLRRKARWLEQRRTADESIYERHRDDDFHQTVAVRTVEQWNTYAVT